MAAPPASYSELLNIAHTQGVGFTFHGAEIIVVDVYPGIYGLDLRIITVTKASNVWTVAYTTTNLGTVGKIYEIIDEDGRHWWHDGLDGFR